MKYCSICGCELKDTDTICPVCGEVQQVTVNITVNNRQADTPARNIREQSSRERSEAGDEKKNTEKASREKKSISRTAKGKEKKTESPKGSNKYMLFPLVLTGLMLALVATGITGKDRKKDTEQEAVSTGSENLEYVNRIATDALTKDKSGSMIEDDSTWQEDGEDPSLWTAEATDPMRIEEDDDSWRREAEVTGSSGIPSGSGGAYVVPSGSTGSAGSGKVNTKNGTVKEDKPEYETWENETWENETWENESPKYETWESDPDEKGSGSDGGQDFGNPGKIETSPRDKEDSNDRDTWDDDVRVLTPGSESDKGASYEQPTEAE